VRTKKEEEKTGLKQANTSMFVPQLDYINGLYNTRGIGKPQKNKRDQIRIVPF